ncbi:Single-strand binding protein family protein [Carex littledalei]|uniref:Single-strand binding protein family protein n=1 Tax=Carex littledalei TaxID=544730 RepID=A0A833R248_9POAL|nr:Single-strand binding protein family protein [Carex littledalei]
MLKWSSNPVQRLHRFFSTVRCPPGGAAADVEFVSGRRSTLRPPPTVKRRSVATNRCSFIGQITAPVRVYKNNSGVFTFLKVKGLLTNQTTSPFEICISMIGELAGVSLQYLQQEQYVYVSGSLCSYNKIHSSYLHHVHYTVCTKIFGSLYQSGITGLSGFI